MNALLILILSFLSSGEKHLAESETLVQETLTTYYFIRHTEKDGSDPQSKDPQLSAEGMVRAKKWAEVLKEVDFDLIYSSDYIRTRTTASIIAENQQKEVDIYDPRKLFDQQFQEKTTGKTVLVVGHSNTNLAFVNSILGSEKYLALDETEYGSLFIVTICHNGAKSSQVLYFN